VYHCKVRLPIHPVQRRDTYICQYCGKDGLESLDNWHDSTIDHVVPRKYGGTDDLTNLVSACHYCNALKSDNQFGCLEDAKEFIARRRGELQVTVEAIRNELRNDPPATQI
jgi:hypothetical protein